MYSIEYKVTPEVCKLAVFIRYLITLKNERRLKAIIAAARKVN